MQRSRITGLVTIGLLTAATSLLVTTGDALAAQITGSGPDTQIRVSTVEPDTGPCVDTGSSPGCPAAEPEPSFDGQPFQAADINADSGKGNPAYFTFPGTSWASLTGSDGPDATSGFSVNPHWVEYDQPFDLVPGHGAAATISADNEVTALYINGTRFETCSQAAPCDKFKGVLSLRYIPFTLMKPTGNHLQIVVRNYGYGLTTGGLDFRIATIDPPLVTVTSPADGASFALNQSINAVYKCDRVPGSSTELGGANVHSCDGPVDPGSAIDTAHAGPHTFTVTSEADDYETTTVTHNYTVLKGDQTITFAQPDPVTFGHSPVSLVASSSAGLPVAFSVTSGPCSVSGSTLTITGAGSCAVTASQGGNSDYNAAPSVSRTINIAKADQSISFTSAAPAQASFGGSSYTATATATSGLPVSLTIDPSASSVCKISGSSVSFIGVGTCQIDADQPGDANYNAAAEATQAFTVAKAATSLTASPARKSLFGLLGLASVRFTVVLTRTDNHAPIAGENVTFSVGNAPACAATTMTDGTATCQANIGLLAGLLATQYTATYAGSAHYQPSIATAGISLTLL